MFVNIWNDFKSKFSSQINSQSEAENTKLFWEKMAWRYVKISETTSDIEYPETEGLDGYDVMESIKINGRTVLSTIWEWPYSIFAYKWNQLLHYIEGDIFIYEFKR